MSDSPILRRVERLFDEANDEERVLSTWELDFLESLQEQLQAGKAATEKQIAKLSEIEEDL